MKQSALKKMLLIATFALFTTIFTSINYCFGWDGCDAEITHPDPENCPDCATEFKDICERWYDGVEFHIHTHVCPTCGFWTVYYHY